jgi:hypothetical protein
VLEHLTAGQDQAGGAIGVLGREDLTHGATVVVAHDHSSVDLMRRGDPGQRIGDAVRREQLAVGHGVPMGALR